MSLLFLYRIRYFSISKNVSGEIIHAEYCLRIVPMIVIVFQSNQSVSRHFIVQQQFSLNNAEEMMGVANQQFKLYAHIVAQRLKKLKLQKEKFKVGMTIWYGNFTADGREYKVSKLFPHKTKYASSILSIPT